MAKQAAHNPLDTARGELILNQVRMPQLHIAFHQPCGTWLLQRIEKCSQKRSLKALSTLRIRQLHHPKLRVG